MWAACLRKSQRVARSFCFAPCILLFFFLFVFFTQHIYHTCVCMLLRRPTYTAISLMDRMADRLRKDKGWDQQIWNEELLFPAYGSITRSRVSLRVMDHHYFANSKTFFYSSRSLFIPGSTSSKSLKPVMLHANYHADKHNRQLCWIARYINGTINACDELPVGS